MEKMGRTIKRLLNVEADIASLEPTPLSPAVAELMNDYRPVEKKLSS